MPCGHHVLGHLHRRHRNLDHLARAMRPSSGKTRPAVRADVHRVLQAVGRLHATTAKALGPALPRPVIHTGSTSRPRLVARHPTGSAAAQSRLQLLHTTLQLGDDSLMLGIDGLLLGDDRQKARAAGGSQVNFNVHPSCITRSPPLAPAVITPPFGPFTLIKCEQLPAALW